MPLHTAYQKAMDQRRSILAGFKVLASITAILVGAFALAAGGLMVAGHIDQRLDDLQQEIMQSRWHLEDLRRDNHHLREQLDILRERQDQIRDQIEGLHERQEDWLERFGVRNMQATAYTLACGNGDGPYVAEDTGGAIRGDRIDIYMGDSPEAYRAAIQWGRREVQVIYEHCGRPDL